MTPESVAAMLQYGALGVLLAVLYFGGQAAMGVYKRMEASAQQNAEFIRRIVDQSNIERTQHLTAWTELTGQSIKTQAEYTKMLEQYTKAFGILEDTMGNGLRTLREEHEVILTGLEKRGLGRDSN